MTPTRLFNQNGTHSITTAQAMLLAELKRQLGPLGTAFADACRALETDDVNLAVEAARRLQSIGVLLGEKARAVG